MVLATKRISSCKEVLKETAAGGCRVKRVWSCCMAYPVGSAADAAGCSAKGGWWGVGPTGAGGLGRCVGGVTTAATKAPGQRSWFAVGLSHAGGSGRPSVGGANRGCQVAFATLAASARETMGAWKALPCRAWAKLNLFASKSCRMLGTWTRMLSTRRSPPHAATRRRPPKEPPARAAPALIVLCA